MKKTLSFVQFKLDIWLLEQLRNTPYPGLTLSEMQERWSHVPNANCNLSRDTLTHHRKSIKEFLGIRIEAPDRLHYRIVNPETIAIDSLANDLLKSIQNYVFLQEYKDLGYKIQPEEIETGSHYLPIIGQALRYNLKLSIKYQKFKDSKPYPAMIHPYCLKAYKGRWYILAYKENNDKGLPAQCFALDRVLALDLTQEPFTPNPDIDPETYFIDCFGIYKDFQNYPVQDITVGVAPAIAPYLRTQPLHRSQKEQTYAKPNAVFFDYHLSPSEDFLGEIARWRGDAWIEENR